MSTLGKRLKKLRKEKDITQEDLGNYLNLRKSTISQYESGTSNPDYATLLKIADFFGASIDYLLGHTNSRQFDLIDALENNTSPMVAGNKLLTQDQRLGILRALDNPSALMKTAKVPIIGYIRTGIPLLSEQNIIGEVDIPADIEGQVDFALYVRGNSMIGTGISEGDIVICKEEHHPYNEQIVVALVNDDETTLKYYIKENGRDVLRAANPEYEDIVLKAGDQIQGRVVKVFKDPPSMNVYRNYIYLRDEHLVDWNEVIETAIGYGIKPERVKSILEMHWEMLNSK